MDDARLRATRMLEAFERSIVAHFTESDRLELASLKEHGLLKDNQILKRAVAIQHVRNSEQEEKLKEVEHLKHVINQYQDQLRKLEETDVILSKRRARRVPFQPLFVNTMSSSISEASGLKATRSSISVSNDQTVEITAPYTANQSFRERNRMWYMVVDTNCLLNKESRRSLRLLQGLKGTQLIVPRMGK
ncbi:hypothetical protein IFM89_008831 [Coptis chinensis]|uniref:PIN domain-containing protein n=1 Tax=Coptis chinensis TaxID=261450 RepID=A0A835LIQ9_9MAGN|nr:hypothetical protein IFM89_008831 [Coptis chinensis]